MTVGAPHGVARSEALRAYLDAALDCVILADASGRVVEFNPAAERTFGYSRGEALGRTLAELIVPPSLRELHNKAFARFVETREKRLFGRRLELTGMRSDGSEFPIELALSCVESDPLLVCGALRDLTDAKRAEGDLRSLAAEQAALRRVATLVADEAAPDVIFASVAEEVARILMADRCAIGRFEADESMTVVAYSTNEEPKIPIGTRIGLHGDAVTAAVRESRRPILIDDHEAFSGPLMDYARSLGALPRSTVAAPIFVESRVWGTIFASTMAVEIADGTESRVVDFAELVATAIANTEARRELERVIAEQQALRRTATLVASGAPPMEVFAAITTSASELFEVPFASLLRFGPDETATMVAGCAACSGFVGQAWTVSADDPGIVRTVVSSRRPARIEDHRGVRGPLGEAARSLGIGSVVGVPVIVDGSVWGVLAVGAAEEGPPLPPDASERLVGFTELATTTLINAEAREEVRSLLDEQETLRRLATVIAQGASADSVFVAVCDEAVELLDAEQAAVVRLEVDEPVLVTVGLSAGLQGATIGMRSALGDWPTSSDACRTGRTARRDVTAEEISGKGLIAEMVRAKGFLSTVSAPILLEGRVWGVMTVSDSRRALAPDTERRIENFTELIATAIGNREARDQVARLLDEQAALRRVATLVAAGIEPDELFSAVCKEIAQLFRADWAAVGCYESDGSGAVLVGASEDLPGIPVGTRSGLDKGIIAGEIYRTGRSARNDDVGAVRGVGDTPRQFLALGFVSTVGAPVVVDGELWGYVAVSSSRTRLPPNSEKRIESFGELVATAIANAKSRAQLAASEARARELADEQAALRRVATLVARGARPDELLSAVADEVAGIIGIPVVGVGRYEADDTFTILGIVGETNFTVGSRWPVEDEGVARGILATGRPSRKDDYTSMPGPIGDALRDDLIVSTVGVPIVVEGSIWGFMVAAAKPGESIPADTEARLARFTELVATAVSNATTRSELIASRARIVAAGDEARRRIERNLHDGTQQRLVALGLDVETVRNSIPADQREARSGLQRVRHELEAVLEDVRELSHGLHPALLSQAGLGPSLRALARRSPIPVNVDVSISERPSESTETAVYYVISEALANVVKHARASEVSIVLTTAGSEIRAIIEDDGCGGAEASAGSGLVGLIDRIEALGGRFALDSPPGHGTRISIEMPLTAEPLSDVARMARGRQSTLDDGPPPLPELSYPVDAGTLHAAVAASADALYVVDPRGRIRFLNRAALRILGYEDERQLLGRSSHDTIHYLRPDGTPFPAAECPLLRPRLNGETVRVDHDWFVRQDGSLVAVAYSSAPVPLEDGRGAVVSFRDISDRATPEEEPGAPLIAQSG